MRDIFTSTLELGEKLKTHSIEFTICPELWKDGDFISKSFDVNDIIELKYLNSDCSDFSNDVNLISTNGGVYFFVIKSNTLPILAKYLVYIGRAKKTENHNLKVRCKKYFNLYNNDNERPKISRMIKQYGNHLYLHYIDLGDNNSLIEMVEAKLINNILPPFNDLIPSKKIRDAVKAFD